MKKNSESRPEAGSRWQSQFFEANIGKISLPSKSGRNTSRRIVFLLFLLSYRTRAFVLVVGVVTM